MWLTSRQYQSVSIFLEIRVRRPELLQMDFHPAICLPPKRVSPIKWAATRGYLQTHMKA